MYSVSDTYKSKMFDSIRGRLPYIVAELQDGSTYTFGEDDIAENSISLDNSSVSGSNFELGGVYVGRLVFTLLNRLDLADSLYNATIKYTVKVNIGTLDEPVYEDIPMGVFIVDETTISRTSVTVTCYDRMRLLDVKVDDVIARGITMYDLLLNICNKCGVEFGMTKSEVLTFPSTGIRTIIGKSSTNSYRDFVMYCAEVMGGFATFDRLGRLVIRRFSTTPVLSIPESVISSLQTDYYDYCVSVVQGLAHDKETELTYDNGNENGFKYIIQDDNKVFRSWWNEFRLEKQQSLEELGKALKPLKYRGMTLKLWCEPSLDLGDMIAVENGGNGLVMDYTTGLYGVETINSYVMNKDDYMGKSQLKRDLEAIATSQSSIKMSIAYVDGSDMVVN